MVPIEVRAFKLLAVSVILLAVVLIVQLIPRRASTVDRPLLALALAIVVVLAIIVLVTTTP